jgi:hypothetical protein
VLTLPQKFIPTIQAFAAEFSTSVFEHARVLLVGAILTPGKRTVTACLRAVGLESDKHYQNYHRVLNRTRWSGLRLSHILFGLLLRCFHPRGAVVLGVDPTLERRKGRKIAAKGVFYDAVRSTKKHPVKSSGLRWISMMLLVPVCWSYRIWALPFLTVLAPPESYHRKRHKKHKTQTDWARQMVGAVKRWLRGRKIVLVADGAFAALKFLNDCVKMTVTVVTPLRMDAALYALPLPKKPGTPGKQAIRGARLPNLKQVLRDKKTRWTPYRLPRWCSKHQRRVEMATGTALWYDKRGGQKAGKAPLPIRWVLLRPVPGCPEEEKFEPYAMLCTDQKATPKQILLWYCQRWELEVTFEDVRSNLGVETQRQWNEKAIARETPLLMGLYSLVSLWGQHLVKHCQVPLPKSAWYSKSCASFSDILALVRRQLYQTLYPEMNDQESKYQGSNCPAMEVAASGARGDAATSVAALKASLEQLTNMLCYAN